MSASAHLKSRNNNLSYGIILLIFIEFIVPQVSWGQGGWTPLTNLAPDLNYGVMLLLSDGSIMCKTQSGDGDSIGNVWDRLTPDIHGSYVNGTWTSLAPMQGTRLYFASQILKDGRVFVAGGEYGSGGSTGETYDPVTNSWTEAPPDTHYFGDANSEILPDGRVLLAVLSDTDAIACDTVVIFNPVTNQWEPAPSSLGPHAESAWVKLADSSILFVDFESLNSERYIPSLNRWVEDGMVPDSLYDNYEGESGAGFLLPDGRAFFIGSTSNTAYYTPSGDTTPGVWTAGPIIPNGLGAPDAPAAMMANGKILCALGPTPSFTEYYAPPTYYYVFDYLTNTFTQLGAPAGGDTDNVACYVATMLDLPDGSVLYAELGNQQYYVYTPDGTPLAAGKPVIGNITTLSCDSFILTGTLFNGITEGAAYGDDWQMATNYPIVRLTTGTDVYYARTFNWNRTGVQTGLLSDTVEFVLPGNLPGGSLELSVIANGNSSAPVAFTSSLPGLSSTLTPPAICTNTIFSYTATCAVNGASVTWTRPAVTGLSNAPVTTPQTSNPNEVLINTISLPVYVTYYYHIVTSTCDNTEQVVVEVDPIPQPDVLYTQGPEGFCSGQSVTIYGNDNGGKWNIGNSTANYITVYTTGTYFVTDSNSCGSAGSNDITISVFQNPVVTLTALADTICSTAPAVTLAGTPEGGFFGGSTQDSIFDPSLVSLGVNYVYYEYIDTDGCSNYAMDSSYVEICTGVNNIASLSPSIGIFPNPTSGMLSLRGVTVQNGSYRVSLTNTDGQTMDASEIKVVNNILQADFNMQEFAPGIYFLTLSSQSETRMFKVLKF